MDKVRGLRAHGVTKNKCPPPKARQSLLTSGWCRLTELPDLQDLAEHLGELNGTSAEWTLVLVLPATVFQHDLQAERKWGLRGGRQGWTSGMRGCPGLYPDVGVLVDFGQVQHVVQGQHSRRSLGEVQGWVDMVLEKPGEQV